MNEEDNKLNIGNFAELARMLKYVDRHDSDEIIATIKQEGEKEMERAKEQLNTASEKLEEITGETCDV